MVRYAKWGACQDNKSGRRVCSSSWCFMGVCVKSPDSQVSHREVWDHHCKPAAWGKKVGDPGKQSIAKENNPESKNQSVCDCCSLEESLQGNLFSLLMLYRLCDRASLQHLVSPSWNFHVNTLFIGILDTSDIGEKIQNLQKNISRKWNSITRIYDGNLGRQRTLQDTTLKTFPPSLFSSKISAYAVEAVKYFKKYCRINK